MSVILHVIYCVYSIFGSRIMRNTKGYRIFMSKLTLLGSMKQMALSALIFGVALTSCGKKDGEGQMQQSAPAVGVVTVKKSNAVFETLYPATIKGKKDVEIRPQVSGFITQVCVDEGQKVSAGQTLFIIDQVQYEAAVRQAEASVAAAQEAVNSATITARNKQTLFNKNVISDYENQLAQNDLATAKANLAQAKAGLVNAKKNLSFTVVKAPSAGYVGSIPNREGSLASPSSAQPLTTVSDISEVYAYISFNEKQVLEMTQNGAVSLEQALGEMPDVRLKLANGSYYSETGKFSTITGLLDNATGSATVRVLFPNQNGMLRSGSTGSIVIPVHANDVILIPQNATNEIQDQKFAYVVGKDNKVSSRPIQVLAQNDGQNYAVVSGLSDGERIVVEGVGVSVRDGSVITPVDAAKQQAAQQKQ